MFFSLYLQKAGSAVVTVFIIEVDTVRPTCCQ